VADHQFADKEKTCANDRSGVVMTQFNPFVGALLPSGQAQRQQAAERAGNVRRAQEQQKNIAHASGDTFEHQVESSDALAAVHDQERRNQQGKTNQHENDGNDTNEDPSTGEQSGLDVTA
jgi:hypothetical protein